MLRRSLHTSNYPYKDARLAFLAKTVMNDFMTGKEGGLADCFNRLIGADGSLLADFCLCIEESEMNPNYLGAQAALFVLLQKETLFSSMMHYIKWVNADEYQQSVLLRAIARLIQRAISQASGRSFSKSDDDDLFADIHTIERPARHETDQVKQVRQERMLFLIMIACLLGDVYMLRSMLASEKYKSVINCRIDGQGLTVLAYAILAGNEPLVKDLLKAGACLQQEDVNEIQIRIGQNRSVDIESLISRFFNLKKYSTVAALVRHLPLDKFHSMLNRAAKSADTKMLNIMISSSKYFDQDDANSLNVIDEQGFSPYSYVLGHIEKMRYLKQCQEARDLKKLAILMKSKGASVVGAEEASQSRESAMLLAACQSEDVDAKFYVRGLIRKGVSANVVDEKTGQTPLVYAVLAHDEDLVLLILQNLTEIVASDKEVQLPSKNVYLELSRNQAVATFIKKLIGKHLVCEANSVSSLLLLCHFYPDLVVPYMQVKFSLDSLQRDLCGVPQQVFGIYEKIAELLVELVFERNLHLYTPGFWSDKPLEKGLLDNVTLIFDVMCQLLNSSMMKGWGRHKIVAYCKERLEELEIALKTSNSHGAKEICGKLNNFLSLMVDEEEVVLSTEQKQELPRVSSAPIFS